MARWHQTQRIKGKCLLQRNRLRTRKERMATIIALKPVTVMEIQAALIERISLTCQLRFHKAFIDTMAERLLRAVEQNAKALS